MPPLQQRVVRPVPTGQSENLKSSVIRARSANPAIQRLRNRVLANTGASEVITSYDRMHHRHSRTPG